MKGSIKKEKERIRENVTNERCWCGNKVFVKKKVKEKTRIVTVRTKGSEKWSNRTFPNEQKGAEITSHPPVSEEGTRPVPIKGTRGVKGRGVDIQSTADTIANC